MRYTITPKGGKPYEFWMRDEGGYVHLESEYATGFLGQQICHGGEFMGDTIEATPETLERVCRAWYRAHTRINGPHITRSKEAQWKSTPYPGVAFDLRRLGGTIDD